MRAVLPDVFGWEHVEAGEGWLTFALPPAAIGVHPADAPSHEVTLTCHNIEETAADPRSKGLEVGEIDDRGFGIGATVVLPGHVECSLYQRRHASPLEAAG